MLGKGIDPLKRFSARARAQLLAVKVCPFRDEIQGSPREAAAEHLAIERD